MKHLYYIILILSFANVGFAKNDIDTISNWQVYKGSQLLFKSHFLDSNRYTSTIKKSDQYKSLRVTFFSDARRSYRKKIELVCGEKILLTINEISDCFTTEIEKKKIDNSLIGYFGKEIFIKYFDDANKQGVVLGILVFKDE